MRVRLYTRNDGMTGMSWLWMQQRMTWSKLLCPGRNGVGPSAIWREGMRESTKRNQTKVEGTGSCNQRSEGGLRSVNDANICEKPCAMRRKQVEMLQQPVAPGCLRATACNCTSGADALIGRVKINSPGPIAPGRCPGYRCDPSNTLCLVARASVQAARTSCCRIQSSPRIAQATPLRARRWPSSRHGSRFNRSWKPS